MDTALSDAISETLARSALWRLAAALFRYPDVEADRELRDPGAWGLAERGAGAWGGERVRRALSAVREEVLSLPREALEAGYGTVFGHTVRCAAPPYETEWGREEGLLQPHRLADLAAFYRAHGLRSAPASERPDHVAVECEFLHFLAFKEAYALSREHPAEARICRETTARFLEEHLGRFALAFAGSLRREAKEGPYAAAADFLHALVVADCASLCVRPGGEDLALRTVSFEDEAGCMSCVARPAGPPG